jgi:hypothetical protein
MITRNDFFHLLVLLGDTGRADIEWANRCKAPADPEEFALEVIFVICNSGMKHTVARNIYIACRAALLAGRSASTCFGHKGKAGAMDDIWAKRRKYFDAFMAAKTDEERLAICAALPWIGGITKYHVAKNFGAQVAKPDVHLQRLSAREDCTAQQLCERLALQTGYRVAAVDTILWRACALGIIDSTTGAIHKEKAA